MPQPSEAPPVNQIPLCVDLDGTLIKSDLLWEHFLRLLKRNPFQLFPILAWWMRGRAFLKRQLARRVAVDPAGLPYHRPFLAWLREQKAAGRKLVLATAADRLMAMPVAGHLGLFDEVLASDGKTNLRSAHKLKLLVEKFGEGGFDYAGNSLADLAVWRGAREAVVVNAAWPLVRRMRRRANPVRFFARDASLSTALWHNLCPRQWVKNAIIFVPAIADHKLRETSVLLCDYGAFVIFCLCSSGVCLVNDLLNLDADRRRPAGKTRPLASGDLPLPIGLALGPALVLGGLALAAQLSWHFAMVTAAYVLLATGTSGWIGPKAWLEVLILAFLYMTRLLAGRDAADIPCSSWLLLFSTFIFLSLALADKYTKPDSALQPAPSQPAARGLGLVELWGVGCGVLAALVLALYVNSAQVFVLYAHPKLLLLICPLLLWWFGRVWWLAHHGRLREEPLVFALTDAASYGVGALTLAIMWLATGH